MLSVVRQDRSAPAGQSVVAGCADTGAAINSVFSPETSAGMYFTSLDCHAPATQHSPRQQERKSGVRSRGRAPGKSSWGRARARDCAAQRPSPGSLVLAARASGHGRSAACMPDRCGCAPHAPATCSTHEAIRCERAWSTHDSRRERWGGHGLVVGSIGKRGRCVGGSGGGRGGIHQPGTADCLTPASMPPEVSASAAAAEAGQHSCASPAPTASADRLPPTCAGSEQGGSGDALVGRLLPPLSASGASAPPSPQPAGASCPQSAQPAQAGGRGRSTAGVVRLACMALPGEMGQQRWGGCAPTRTRHPAHYLKVLPGRRRVRSVG